MSKNALPVEVVQSYLDKIYTSYAQYMGNRNGSRGEEMVQEFKDGLSVQYGSKYLKVMTSDAGGGQHVHSFIVLKDGGKFKRGDILMAASWATPATNFSRGNVLQGKTDRVYWTGAS